MLLTCEQALQAGLLILDESKGKAAQIGYDLSVKEIRAVEDAGAIWRDSTDAPILSPPLETEQDYVTGRQVWYLEPGVYDVTFWEGCKLADDTTGFISHRSSVNRNGGIIKSAVFDPGFHTTNIGTMLYTTFPLTIEVNARLAQIYFHKHESVKEGYNGQWQGDKWRERGNPANN